MKKELLICTILLCTLLSACGPQKNNNDTNTDNEPAPSLTITDSSNNGNTDNGKIVGSNTPKNIEDWEPMGIYNEDITNDGEEEIISLYTSAQRDKRGDMMWDDTQEWVLRISDNDSEHDLFDERINGFAYMNVSEYYNENDSEKVISLYIQGNSFNEIREYRYDGENYIETVMYTTNNSADEGISTLYSSMPYYE